LHARTFKQAACAYEPFRQGAGDLSLPRLGEGHADAVAILAELGGPHPVLGAGGLMPVLGG
jgi:hypothetical protein